MFDSQLRPVWLCHCYWNVDNVFISIDLCRGNHEVTLRETAIAGSMDDMETIIVLTRDRLILRHNVFTQKATQHYQKYW